MNFQDYDYTYICNDNNKECSKMVIENDMILLLQGKGDILTILRDMLPNFIREKLENSIDIIATLKQTCLDINSLIKRCYNSSGYATMSGIISVMNEHYILHVGDCKIVTFSGIIPTYVSLPHKMKNKHERNRISSSTFIHRGKAEGLFKLTRCFGNYALTNELYEPLPHVEKVGTGTTHIFLYSKTLKVELAELITTVLCDNEKASTTIVNRNLTKNNMCLMILRLSK